MTRQHKFTKGPLVESIISAVAQINAGRWLYFNNKPMHPAWLEHWSIAQLNKSIKYKQLFYAISKKGD